MSILERLRAWLRLDTDGPPRDLGRYDASEREMEARVRVLEARVEALQLRADVLARRHGDAGPGEPGRVGGAGR